MESSRPPNHATPTLAFFPPQNSSPSDYALFHLTTSPDNWIMNLIYWTRQRPIQNSHSVSLGISRHDNSSCSPTFWVDWGRILAFPTKVICGMQALLMHPTFNFIFLSIGMAARLAVLMWSWFDEMLPFMSFNMHSTVQNKSPHALHQATRRPERAKPQTSWSPSQDY